MAFDGVYVSDDLVNHMISTKWCNHYNIEHMIWSSSLASIICTIWYLPYHIDHVVDTYQKQFSAVKKFWMETLSYSGTCFIGGLIMDHYGTRALRLISNVLLTGGSLVLAFADSNGRWIRFPEPFDFPVFSFVVAKTAELENTFSCGRIDFQKQSLFICYHPWVYYYSISLIL